jgi:hypothetical protein
MNPSNYQAWMDRAFLFVEGTLLRRAAEESPTRITEDFVRGALIDGLKASKPEYANNVVMEEDVPWNLSPDINNPSKGFGRGRARQHDVAFKNDGKASLVCEVKWLKTKDPAAILADVWKLALTHSLNEREKNCCRTFLLVGGLKKPFQDTLTELRRHKVPLRWSPQGKANGWPRPSNIDFGFLYSDPSGFDSLVGVLKRGDKYHRQPPAIWYKLRCSTVARSWKTIRDHAQNRALGNRLQSQLR